MRLSDHHALSWRPKNGTAGTPRTLDLLPYLKLKLLLESVSDARHASFANAAALPAVTNGSEDHD
jgi:hypothetical protein